MPTFEELKKDTRKTIEFCNEFKDTVNALQRLHPLGDLVTKEGVRKNPLLFMRMAKMSQTYILLMMFRLDELKKDVGALNDRLVISNELERDDEGEINTLKKERDDVVIACNALRRDIAAMEQSHKRGTARLMNIWTMTSASMMGVSYNVGQNGIHYTLVEVPKTLIANIDFGGIQSHVMAWIGCDNAVYLFVLVLAVLTLWVISGRSKPKVDTQIVDEDVVRQDFINYVRKHECVKLDEIEPLIGIFGKDGIHAILQEPDSSKSNRYLEMFMEDKRKVERFYEHVQPGKNVNDIVRKYRSNMPVLFMRLKKKYPDSAWLLDHDTKGRV